MMRPALLLDRDGVVNRDLGYVGTIERFAFMPGIFSLVRRAVDAGLMIIIVTNQSGIGRGFFSEDDFRNLMSMVAEQFSLRGGRLDAVYFCPHHPDATISRYRCLCDSRKPAPGMIYSAAKIHGLDLARSIFVGDQETDIDAARAAGVGHIYQYLMTVGERCVSRENVSLVERLDDITFTAGFNGKVEVPKQNEALITCC